MSDSKNGPHAPAGAGSSERRETHLYISLRSDRPAR